VRLRAGDDAHDQPNPNNGLGLFKLEAPRVKRGCAGNNHARPTKGEANVGVEVDLLEEVGAGEELQVGTDKPLIR
jgi:hypothetical protein